MLQQRKTKRISNGNKSSEKFEEVTYHAFVLYLISNVNCLVSSTALPGPKIKLNLHLQVSRLRYAANMQLKGTISVIYQLNPIDALFFVFIFIIRFIIIFIVSIA